MFKSRHQTVLVRHEGRWVRARLIDTISDIDGLWRALVGFTAADGRRYREWRPVQDLRPVEMSS